MGTLQGSWIWYELMTTDPEAAKAFYEAVIGWQITPGSPATGGYGFISNADGGMTGGMLTLDAAMCAEGARPTWLGYVGVDDCDAAVAAIAAAGGKCLMPPHDVPMAGRIAMVSDCCGAPFYVMTPKPVPGGGESICFSAQPHSGRCGWNELMAKNQQHAIDFYTSMFGWTLPDAMDMGPLGTYQFIAHDDVGIGAIMTRPAEVPAPMWCHYFWTDSVTAAKDRVTAHGGQVVNGPHEVPGRLWIIQGVDPQGALFSLVGEA